MVKNNAVKDLLFFILWFIALFSIAFILLYPATHAVFIEATNSHPYAMGFIKVSILATMGELLALRIGARQWKRPVGLVYRAFVWGFLGTAFVIVFDLFAGGVTSAMGKGLLPSAASNKALNQFIFAFFTSAFMNAVFGPTFMMLHRITDTYIDLGEGQFGKILKVRIRAVVDRIDFYGFISFVVLKTIPVFWIPAHTVTFLLPTEYRVLMAAFLSIALGGILAFAKRRPKEA